MTVYYIFYQSSDGPSYKIFKWKDKEMEEEYYKDHLCKMRYEVCKKEDCNTIVKA